MSSSTGVPFQHRAAPTRPHWCITDIDFDGIDRSAIAGDRLVFTIVFLASFIETGSDLYAGNLTRYFADDDEVSGWLRESWQREEVQHGHALRAYAEHAWPEIDWQRSYDGFFAEYSRTCTVEALEPARGLELAARCIVEMGTSTFYSALQDYAREPVLKDLAGRIFADEARHYKHFYRYFRRYQEHERHSRLRIGRTLLRRLLETRTGDGYHAFRQLRESVHGSMPLDADYGAFTRSFAAFIRRHGPREMPIRMALKPLQLPPAAVRWLVRHGAPAYGLWSGWTSSEVLTGR